MEQVSPGGLGGKDPLISRVASHCTAVHSMRMVPT